MLRCHAPSGATAIAFNLALSLVAAGSAMAADPASKAEAAKEVDSATLKVHPLPPQPAYPEVGLKAKIQGTVLVEAWIGADGAVTRTEAHQGPPMFRDCAAGYVKQWTVDPVKDASGTAVPVRTRFTVLFRLEHPDGTPGPSITQARPRKK